MFNIVKYQKNENYYTARYHFVPVGREDYIQKSKTINNETRMRKKLKHLYIVGGITKQCNCSGKQCGGPQKLKIGLLYGSAIALLNIY